jgi:hypothetical protein
MLRIYGTENLTQRNDHSSAIAGLIAGAIKLVARRDFHLVKSRDQNPQGRQDLGIGWERILAELDGLRGQRMPISSSPISTKPRCCASTAQRI